MPLFWYRITMRERSAIVEKLRAPRPPLSELLPTLMNLSIGFSMRVSRSDMEKACKWWISIGEEKYGEVKHH